MVNLPKTMRAIQIEEQGPVENMKLSEVPLPEVGENEVLVKSEWAGVNFIDTYQRGGLYKLPSLPATLGKEAAGVIAKLGSKVDPSVYGYNVGDRVAVQLAGGGYAEYALSHASQVGKIPDSMSTKTGAAALLQGLTAITNITESHHVKEGEYVLVHAAAGGLGLLLCQMCKAAGAYVIGTTSTQEKADLAMKNGADEVILYKDVAMEEGERVAKQVKALTPNGEGVHAVFDGVGKDTFDINFELLRRKGSLVSIGNASGAVPPVAPLRLAGKNLKLSRPTLMNSIVTKEEFQGYWNQLADLIVKDKVHVGLYKEEGYPFTSQGVQQAHKDIASRATSGKLLIKIA